MAKPAGSSLRFTCPSCGGSVKAPRSQAGAACVCPKCGAQIAVPAADQAGERRAKAGGKSEGGSRTPQTSPPTPTRPERRGQASGEEDDDFRLSAPVTPPRYESSFDPLLYDNEPTAQPPEPPGERAEATAAGEPLADIRIVCRLCGTRLYATLDQVGKTLRCPDCDTGNVVKPPAAPRQERDATSDIGELPELFPPIERSQQAPLGAAGRSEQAPGADPSAPAKWTTEFAFVCTLCGSRLYAAAEQAGQSVVCSDCRTSNVVPQPPAGRAETDDGPDGQLKLSDPVERPEYESLARPVKGAGPAEGSWDPKWVGEAEPGRLPMMGDDALVKAEAELREKERATPKLPGNPLLTGVWAFFGYRSTVTYCLLLSLAACLITVLIRSAVALMGGGGIAQFWALVCFAFLAILTPAALFGLAACCVAVVADSANGADEISRWPNIDFLEWLPDSFYVINGMFFGGMPGLALYWLLGLVGAPTWLGTLAALIPVLMLFPVALLSMLENGSLLNPFSGPVWDSLTTARRYWKVFFAQAALLALVGWLGCLLLVQGGQLTVFFASAWLVVAVMLYCRLLGRLAWVCQEAAPINK